MNNLERAVSQEAQKRRIQNKKKRAAIKLAALTPTKVKTANTVYRNYPPGVRPVRSVTPELGTFGGNL